MVSDEVGWSARVLRYAGFGFLLLAIILAGVLLSLVVDAQSVSSQAGAHLYAHSGPAMAFLFLLGIGVSLLVGMACIGLSIPVRRARVGVAVSTVVAPVTLGSPGLFGLTIPIQLVGVGWWLIYDAWSKVDTLVTLSRALAVVMFLQIFPTSLRPPSLPVALPLGAISLGLIVRRRRAGDTLPALETGFAAFMFVHAALLIVQLVTSRHSGVTISVFHTSGPVGYVVTSAGMFMATLVLGRAAIPLVRRVRHRFSRDQYD